ncbi:MAG: ATP-binding protein [Candidatus Melainabacteria bacterium]|nr:ATP-binding protein [Candidatus Melainabacteria bacterium]
MTTHLDPSEMTLPFQNTSEGVLGQGELLSEWVTPKATAAPFSTLSLLPFLLEESENPLMRVLREMGDGVFVCDAQGRLQWTNQAVCDMLELPGCTKSLIGKIPGREAMHGLELEGVVAEVLARGHSVSREIQVAISPSRPKKSFQIQIAPLTKEGHAEVTGCLAVFRDITPLKTTEKMRRDFVANVSHELRTPLSVLKGYAETLLDGALSDPVIARDFIEIIHRHAIRLSNLVEDLLDLSRLEAQDFKLDLEPVRLEPFLERVRTLALEHASGKAIAIRTKISPGLPQVLAHANSLEQVFTNLVDNAIKYTPEHGTVTLTAFEVGPYIQVDVADTGIGIETKHIPRLFERFYRVDKARSRDQGGTGLGLSIVKHIVQIHGGDIWVESNPNEGSTFSFTLRKAMG